MAFFLSAAGLPLASSHIFAWTGPYAWNLASWMVCLAHCSGFGCCLQEAPLHSQSGTGLLGCPQP